MNDSVLENEKIIRSAFATHKRYYLRAVLLEVFGKNEPLDIYGAESHLISEVQKTGGELFDAITYPDVEVEYEYLVRMGYYTTVENDTKITLTEHGMKALRECVWENLASSAFFGYKGLYISDRSLKVSKIACIIAASALLVSVISIVLSLCK